MLYSVVLPVLPLKTNYSLVTLLPSSRRDQSPVNWFVSMIESNPKPIDKRWPSSLYGIASQNVESWRLYILYLRNRPTFASYNVP